MSELTELQQISKQIQDLQARQQEVLHKAMLSNDPHSIMKAYSVSAQLQQSAKQQANTSKRSTIISDPYSNNNTRGYQQRFAGVSEKMLRKIAKTPVIAAVIGTRIDQVCEFLQPAWEKYEVGFRFVRRERNKRDGNEKLYNNKKVRELEKFILNCSVEDKKWVGDNIEDFIRKWLSDSLVLDHAAFEVVQDRRFRPTEFVTCDSSTIRKVDHTYDSADIQKVNGYAPEYVQLYEDTIISYFYPWEMCLGIRNPQNTLTSNGYGMSELEVLIKIVTWMLWGDQHNGNFFSQGSAPKGVWKAAGVVNETRLSEFRQEWWSMVSGVQNSWKTPLIQADDFEWIDMQKSNRDMEFSKWQEYLLKIACSVYRIDPSEIGFHLSGSSGSQSLFEGNNEARLKYSRDKGLRPLMRFIQRKLNRWLIEPLTDEFVLEFVGLDSENEKDEVELDAKRVGSIMGLKEAREKAGLPRDLEDDDIVLNPQYIQWLSQQAMGGQESNEAIDEYNEEGDQGEFYDFNANPVYKAFEDELKSGAFN